MLTSGSPGQSERSAKTRRSAKTHRSVERRSVARGRCTGDDGSVLMLMPAAVLVVLVLGAIAVDLSAVHLAERNLLDLASSMANDAVTAGLPPEALRSGGEHRLDTDRVRDALTRTLAAQGHGDEQVVAIDLSNTVPATVTVTLSRPVEHIFAKALPGADDATTVRATGTATASER